MDCSTSDDSQKLIEELRQHQFELSQQNEELRRTYEELNRVTEKFRDLWHHAPIGYVSHTRSGTITASNEPANKVLEAIAPVRDNSTLQSFLEPKSQQVFRQHILSIAASSNAGDIDVCLATKPGEREVWLRLESVVSPDGGFRTAMIDISARKEAEAERLALASQLRQSQKMDVLHDLSAGIAHDFNNILQVILAWSELVETDIEAAGGDTSSIAAIVTGAKRGADLTRRLLAFSRKSSLEAQPTDLRRIVDDAVAVVKRTVGEHILLNSQVAETTCCSVVDGNLIEQALLNLCLNARDAMPSGGHLLIDLHEETLQNPLIVNGCRLPPGKYSTIVVADDGSGMSEEVAERIFEPFFTTKPATSGTGLGLSIVYGIIRQHNGTINVESNPGDGSRFTIYLPACSAAEISTCRDAGFKSSSDVKRRGTVLVAEDEDAIREVLVGTLQKAGHTVIAARDGSDALEKLNSNQQDIQLVLTDVVMPNASGKDLCEAVHSTSPRTPVIFLTGHGDGVIDSAFLDDHDALLLSKPLDSTTLLHHVNERLLQTT